MYLAKAFCISSGVSDTEDMTAERGQRQKPGQKGRTLELKGARHGREEHNKGVCGNPTESGPKPQGSK